MCVKLALFGLLCAWREVLILRQQSVNTDPRILSNECRDLL
jgi:hypothetical protein